MATVDDIPETRRAALVAAAQAGWVSALTDLGGRNTLLYYKDRRAGTLDLAGADPELMDRFQRTGSVRVTRLFQDADVRADAIRRVQAIHRKARELLEERGIRAGYLATGLARWDELFLEPAAPVLLRGLTIVPTRARHDDFELVLDDEPEVNPVLLHKLGTVFGADVTNLGTDPYQDLRKIAQAAEVPGFEIVERSVIGTFTYAKLPMVQDLQSAGELLADSDVVAALAGDPEAQRLLAMDNAPVPVTDTPEDDYTVLDADSSQRGAIAAVQAGRSLVVHGPPGTGKSQTIANMIATLVARGRKVLFVAEKRAAIDAVLSRLHGVDLSDLVLDIHDGTRDRLRIARDLGSTLDRARHDGEDDDAAPRRRLAERQRRLDRHVDALHEPHPPWDLTPYQVQSALLGIPEQARVQARVAAPERMDGEEAERVREELREFAHLRGFELRADSTPWYGAVLRTAEDARRACSLAGSLSSYTYPKFTHALAQAEQETGNGSMALFEGIEATLRVFSAEIYAADPAHLLAAFEPRQRSPIGFRERRALQRTARALWADPAEATQEEIAAALARAARHVEVWQGGGVPRLPSNHAELVALEATLNRELAELRDYVPIPQDEPGPVLEALVADQDTAWRLPRLYELGARFHRAGLVSLLDELARRDPTPELAAAAFDHAWYSAILDQIKVRDPRYLADRGDALDRVVGDFQSRDVAHLVANRRRVRGAWAVRLREAEERHPLQARVIRKQVALRRGHLALRRLLDQAGDALFALKPCWAMSPLMVSQVLPAARLFDVVIFDEASQIVPSDAVPSIMRGHQIVIAGDDRQLPPTNFFRQVGDGFADTEEEDLVSFGTGFESVLDSLRPLLPTCPLTWHYRSRDERLVAFSNARIYGGALTTFPGVFTGDCLRHVVVTQDPAPSEEGSVTAEVDRVVELITEHARRRPAESLGVIALGIRHAERIDLALRAALTPDVEEFFAEDRAEPFFVKNLERVQGDERDAIILSVGYGRHPDGRMRYQWGPLLRDGGERRLNVAATRAKHRLTLVSSFSSHDIDRDRVTKPGARLLADYLEYAGSGGTAQVSSGGGELTPFETDVQRRLATLGIMVVPRYGVGGYRVDFAAAHPDDHERMILAIEADGTAYRGSGRARDRDRLRQEHLERLGWRFHRLWSSNWFLDPRAELAKISLAYEQALAAAPPRRPGTDLAPREDP